jgi:hypothetical protein
MFQMKRQITKLATQENQNEEETFSSYELFLHYKQGDDFRSFLDDVNGDIPKALKNWAAFMRENASHCEKLAKAMKKEIAKGSKFDVNADTHMIAFCGDEKALDRLAKAGLIQKEVFEE